jgi:hypothetical protein
MSEPSYSASGLAPDEPPPSEAVKHQAYGEAALMLVESLMFVLIEQGIFTRQQMIVAVESAIATKRQMVQDGNHPEIAAVAAGMLSVIANSLAADKASPAEPTQG